jgi:hypothetical protein
MLRRRRQFTIRGLMIGIALTAGLLGLALNHSELLPPVIVVGIPLAGLIGLLRRVPTDRPGWRLGVHAAMLGWLILGAGWLCAQLLVWWCKQQANQRGTSMSTMTYNGVSVWLNLLLFATAFCLIAHALGLARFCRDRRESVGCMFALGYATALALAYLLMVVTLGIQLNP